MTKDDGRFRGSGTRPAIGSDCDRASAEGATGGSGTAEAMGGAGQMSLDVPAGANGAALGVGLGDGLAPGFDMANLAGAVAAGLGGGTPGALLAAATLDVMVIAAPAGLPFPVGVLRTAFTAGAAGKLSVGAAAA